MQPFFGFSLMGHM